MKIHQRRFIIGLLTPAIIVLLLVYVIPMIQIIWMSFLDLNVTTLLQYLRAPFVGLKHYQDILGGVFGGTNALINSMDQSVVNSFWYTFWVEIGTIGLGLLFALLLNRKFGWREIALSILLVPWAVPSSAAGLIWGVIFRPLDGLANQIAFSWLHLSSFPIHWLSGDAARVTLILPSIWRWAPFSTIIFLAALHFIPADQYEAASIDGANGWQKFRYITWPFLAPAMAALVLFGIIYYFFGLNGYNIGYLLFNNDYFGRSAELFIPMLVRQTFVSNLFGFGAAISVLLMAVSALVLGLGYWVYRTFSESL